MTKQILIECIREIIREAMKARRERVMIHGVNALWAKAAWLAIEYGYKESAKIIGKRLRNL